MKKDLAVEWSDFSAAKQHQTNHWQGLYGSALALALTRFVKQQNKPILLLAEDIRHREQLLRELNFYCADESIEMIDFPDWEVLPYDKLSPHQAIVSARFKALKQLQTLQGGIVVATLAALMQRLVPPAFVNDHRFVIHAGDQIAIQTLAAQLLKLGYHRAMRVTEHGEFAIKGAIIDIFAMGAKQPFRLDLFDDEIETIKFFDVDTQRSAEQLDSVELMPAREIATDDDSINHFVKCLQQAFGTEDTVQLVEGVKAKNFAGGIELYLPFFFAKTATLFDYLPATMISCLPLAVEEQANTLWQQITQRYQTRFEEDKLLLSPEKLFVTPAQLKANFEQYQRIIITQTTAHGECHSIDFKSQLTPPISAQPQAEKPLRRLSSFIKNYSGRILFIAESFGRQDVLSGLLKTNGYESKERTNWADFLAASERLSITVASLDKGFLLPEIAVITEADVFGRESIAQRHRRRAKHKDFGETIKNLAGLKKKEPIVHERYGVGRYLGLKCIEHDGRKQDFITILYADKAKLMVPITALNLISRYSGANSEHAPLHRLGSQQWARAKKKAAQALYDVAAELLEVYAKRQKSKGFAAFAPGEAYSSFVNEFAFEETPDQLNAIEEILNDMQKNQPMDRVICGDVGFGKTEIAMRAAFLAVESGKQVALLAPTTLLVSQHKQTFIDRFAKHPINIGALSRFQSAAQQKKTIADIAAGKVDIVIGTHTLLNRSVKYADLGLVIIDEEHRFGVRQKEKLKALRSEVDILITTATPIPRTLNMALGSLRDLSIIATPPKNRVAVKTFISPWQDTVIKEAFLREAHRGGQVFFVHNDINTIDLMAEKIKKLLVNSTVRIAHAKMPAPELAMIMQDFYHQRFDVLLSTTIIESGIDIPSANTIIINNAQNFGLAQLHQLRGRVGRSHHQAYAYLLIKPYHMLTEGAKKRLDAIASLESLGAGFMLANHDLEIRGAGELLGAGQSGKIQEIGFSLYHKLLAQTIEAMQQHKTLNLDALINTETEVELTIPAILPATYVADVHERLVFYKRIASSQDSSQLADIRAELIERFGLLPPPAAHLFAVTKLKQQAFKLSIEKLIAGDEKIKIVFYENPPIDHNNFVKLLNSNPESFRFDGNKTLTISRPTTEEERVDYIEQLIKTLIG